MIWTSKLLKKEKNKKERNRKKNKKMNKEIYQTLKKLANQKLIQKN